ncbi:MAG: M56 family metallopeptidase, partial [Vicinamibacterales bacterium]
MTSWLPFDVLDHLWQSTLFAGAVWLVARAMRANAARVRYWLWFAVSVKFLVPISLLVSIGERFAWRTAPPAPLPAAAVIEQVLTPAATAVTSVSSASTASSPTLWPLLLLGVWSIGVGLVLAQWWRQWVPIRRALRDARPINIDGHEGVAVRASASMIEPAVFGIWHPVLLVPDGISDRLTPPQLRALFAHERCHIRHHDNLTATLHMAVEALFWFHPIVWWLERRLIEERERACDEFVLQSGSSPQDYAEGILQVCRFAKDPPPVFVTGVGGPDLRRRIEAILRGAIGGPVGPWRRSALVIAASASIGLPIAVGAMTAVSRITITQEPSVPISFAVASVKVNRSGERAARTEESVPGIFSATNVWLSLLITYAYGIQNNQIESAPDWTRTLSPERFDVAARLEQTPPGVPDAEAKRLAMRTLLAERFKLEVKRETREVPMYALVMARADGRPGPMLRPSSTDCSATGMKARAAAEQAGKPLSGFCGLQVNTGRIRFGGRPMSEFARVFNPDGRNVIDRTGLTGNWDFELRFMTDRPGSVSPGQNEPPIDPDAPSLPAALQEQLGLKLEPTRGLVEKLVVERVERPTEN